MKICWMVGLLCLTSLLHAQDRCGTVIYQKMLQKRNPSRETTNQFEQWVKTKLAKKLAQPSALRTAGSVSYQVPVVVHVINNGEAVGSGTNISDAQIQSQIDVLNADFQRLNADSVKTPAAFQSTAGKFPITFVLARQDPDGLATTGIVRVKGTQTSWSIDDNYTFKALSYWPAEDYFNIWVINLSGGFLGYTQLPVSSTLSGLTDASNDRLTDGVVIDYRAFGTNQNGGNYNIYIEYNLGRTATHEVGHFFGLRHVWGDSTVFSCMATDYVSDTPPQDTNYLGVCPSGDHQDCGQSSMYDNYMNYTDDACMNIFSRGQVSRMDVIINNSPRRASLLTSHGLLFPSPVPNDAGIKSITSPAATACAGNLVPSLLIRNYGTNVITSTQISLTLNGSPVETKTFAVNLATGGETTVAFSPVSLSLSTSYRFSFQVMQTNATTDGAARNDTLSILTNTPSNAVLPMNENFATTPAGWVIQNPDGLTTWKNISLASGRHAMFLDYYNYDNTGTRDRLITPILDLSTVSVASLSFEWAYAQFSGGSNDGLRVLVSTSCDFDGTAVEVFNRSGSALATSSQTSGAFVPTSTDWSSVLIPLAQFVGKKIQIAFEGINAFGNDLYLDNVTILNSAVTGFSISKLVTPSPVGCLSQVAPVVEIQNLGNVDMTSLAGTLKLNGSPTQLSFTGMSIPPGGVADLTLPTIALATTPSALTIVLKNPNGITTGSSIIDSVSIQTVVNTSTDVIPLRENFNASFPSSWTTISPGNGSIWYPTPTTSGHGNSMLFDAFTNTVESEQGWLVTPVLDFSRASSASVFFQTSYAYHPPNADALKVYASTDCGESFTRLLFSSSGLALADTTSYASWKPKSSTAWTQRYINLDSLAGKSNVRLAFVGVNANGNNIYLDDIEFFVSDNASPPTISSDFAVYGGVSAPIKVTFNLDERQTVRLQVYDITGRIFADEVLPDILNQTFEVNTYNNSPGMYIVRVQTNQRVQSTKVIIGF